MRVTSKHPLCVCLCVSVWLCVFVSGCVCVSGRWPLPRSNLSLPPSILLPPSIPLSLWREELLLARTVWGADFEIDGNVGDALVVAGDAVSLVLNLLANVVKVCELAALAVIELPILCNGSKKGNDQPGARRGSRRNKRKQRGRGRERERERKKKDTSTQTIKQRAPEGAGDAKPSRGWY